MAESCDLFDPNQLGNPQLMFNPARGILDMNGYDIINCPNTGGGGGGGYTPKAGSGIDVDLSGNNATISLQDISGSFTTNYVAGLTVDTYGRVTNAVQLGYIPAPFTSLQYYMPYTGGSFTGEVLYYNSTPTKYNEIVVKDYLDRDFLNSRYGGNISSMVTYYTNTPTNNNELATKLYVDNKVAGGGGGGGSITIQGGSNINVNNTNPSQPVVNLAVTQNIDMNSKGLSNVDFVNGSGLIFPIGSLGQLTLTSATGLTMVGGTNASLTSPGNVLIGSGLGHTEVEKVSITENVIEPVTGGSRLVLNGVDSIDGISFTPDGTIQTGGTITCKDFAVGNLPHHTDIARLTNADPMLTLSNDGVGTIGGVLDTQFNPPSFTLSGTGNRTLNLQAKNGSGTLTTITSQQLPTNLFVSANPEVTLTNGDIVNLTAAQANQTFSYNIASGQAIINLPNNAPVGSSFFIYVSGAAAGTVLVKTPIVVPSTDLVLTPNSGAIWTVNQLVLGVSVYINTDSLGTKLGAYVPLAGTATGSNVTGTIKIDDTGGLQAKFIQTNQIGALTSPNNTLNLNAPTTVNNTLTVTDNLAIYKPGGTQTFYMGDASGSATRMTANYVGANNKLTINKNFELTSNLTINGGGINTTALTINTGQADIGGRLNVNGSSNGIGLKVGNGHVDLIGAYNVQNVASFIGNSATITTVNTTTLNATNATFTNAPIVNQPATHFSLPGQLVNKVYVDTLFMGGVGIQATSSADMINDFFVGNTKWRAHIFTTVSASHTFTITNPGGTAQTCDMIIMAGGGSGGTSASSAICAGGGGAGMLIMITDLPVYQTATYPQTWGVAVGGGAPAQTIIGNSGNVGSNSYVSLPADQTPFGLAQTIYAMGGGGGAGSAAAASTPLGRGTLTWRQRRDAATNLGWECGGGGSGGIGAQNAGGSFYVTSIYNIGMLGNNDAFGGFAGGARGTSAGQMGGGGGGVRGPGGASGSPGEAGVGGCGICLSGWDGTYRKFGGGGSGARLTPSGAPGNVGSNYGGGIGSLSGVSLATSADPGTGAGGGGANFNEVSGAGAAGFVIIRYRL